MKSKWLRVLASCIALALAACHGNGEEEGGDTSETPPPPATPAPTPSPPPSSNRAPEANAGEDRSTVEEQDVTVDGSRTRDPDEDALAYDWQLLSAPDGSGVTVNADSATFIFRPDLPGTYQLQLTASDGTSSDTDTMRVTARALLTFDDRVTFKIRIGDGKKGKETRSELDLETSSLYRGEPIAYTATSDVPWLRVLQPAGTSAAPGDTVSVPVEVVMVEAERLQSGEHEARVMVAPAGGWEQAVGAVTLELEHDDDDKHSIVPYVAYTGQSSSVALYGERLLGADGASVFIDGTRLAPLEATSNERATIELPPLPAGVYTLQIGSAGELSSERIVVRDEPVHRTAELALPGLTRSLEYDPERDAFYAVFVAPDGTRIAQRLQNSGTGEWVSDTIPVHAPWAVALTADGAHLLVTSDACTIHRLEPQTLGVLQSLTKASCDPAAERLGALAVLADGRVLVVDDVGDSSLWEYPDLTPLAILPSRQNALLVLNGDRNRLLWAGSPHGGRSLGIGIYDVATPDGEFDALGTPSEIESSLDQRGTRAIALDLSANTLSAFRASSARGELSPIGEGMSMPTDVRQGSRIFVPPSGAAAFAFTLSGPGEPRYRLYVRELNERL